MNRHCSRVSLAQQVFPGGFSVRSQPGHRLISGPQVRVEKIAMTTISQDGVKAARTCSVIFVALVAVGLLCSAHASPITKVRKCEVALCAGRISHVQFECFIMC